MIGLIKMEARCVKQSQNSGPIGHRFVVLLGQINVKIANLPIYKYNEINTVVKIPKHTIYSIENTQDDDTYLFFKSGPKINLK